MPRRALHPLKAILLILLLGLSAVNILAAYRDRNDLFSVPEPTPRITPKGFDSEGFDRAMNGPTPQERLQADERSAQRRILDMEHRRIAVTTIEREVLLCTLIAIGWIIIPIVTRQQ